MTIDCIGRIYEHPQNSACKLIKEGAELVLAFSGLQTDFLMVIRSIYRRPKSGFAPAVSGVKTNNKNACFNAFGLVIASRGLSRVVSNSHSRRLDIPA